MTDSAFTRWRVIEFYDTDRYKYLAIKTTVEGIGSSPIIDAKARETWADAARDGINTGMPEYQNPNRR